MKEMYNNYKKELSKKNNLVILIIVIFLIGITFGSIYITILSNSQKSNIISQIALYFKSMNKISIDDKIDIFKNSLYSNLLYTIFMWVLGLSVIGLPIVFIMIFFKSFILGFSVSSIFAKYGINGLLRAILYIFPSNIIFMLFIIFLSTYSVLISNKIFFSAIKKQSINFNTFMGKYFFILVIGILISILCSLYEAFVNPYIYQIIF